MIVEARGLTKRFPVRRTWQESLRAPLAAPSATVLHDVSFSVERGEIFGLLGQNGAGKTTLFKLLATLIVPDAGTATVDGHDVTRDAREIRDILAPVLANERSLYWRLSAVENLRLYAALQGLSGRAASDEIARVLGVTGLADTGNKMVGMFSSGMRQRLLIARALLARPRVLLLDEPTRSLDPISARDLRMFLRDVVVRQEGCTILLATHDAEEVWELCDRVGVLERGRLLAVERTQLLRERAGTAAYEMWLRASDAAARVARVAGMGVQLARVGPAPDEGWEIWRGEIPGGASEAAQVLAALNAPLRTDATAATESAASVARFEKATPSLAALIERVLTHA